MTVRAQRVLLPSGELTWTVLGADHLPVPPVEMFLEHRRQSGGSPNTVRSYSRALALWCEFLELQGLQWEEVSLEDATMFLSWLRTGIPPGVVQLGEGAPRMADSSVEARLQAVRSFYVFHQWRGLEVAPWLHSGRSSSRASSYQPLLHHVHRPRAPVTLRVRHGRRTVPTLTPTQMGAIKGFCAKVDPGGDWSGTVRDRLFFQLLEETGLRIGEALSLQHRDWHIGKGENPYLEVVERPHPHGVRAKSGYRKIYISDALDRLYAEYVWRLCDAGMDLVVNSMDSAYVFVNLHGPRRFAPIRPETVYKLVDRIRDHFGDRMPRWTPHWFRHTHATALLLSGVPVHVVSRRLGHRDVQTTLNTYAWATEDAELRAVAEWREITAQWRAAP